MNVYANIIFIYNLLVLHAQKIPFIGDNTVTFFLRIQSFLSKSLNFHLKSMNKTVENIILLISLNIYYSIQCCGHLLKSEVNIGGAVRSRIKLLWFSHFSVNILKKKNWPDDKTFSL